MSELWTALQDPSLKFIDRLKIACHLWKHECTSNSRKRRCTLIRWACEEVCTAHSKKNKTPPSLEVYCKLWQLLSVMLETIATPDSFLGVDSSMSTHFFQSMMEVFSWQDYSQLECSLHVLKCLQLLVNGPSLPSVLHKYEITAALLESLLKFGKNLMIHHDDMLLPSLVPPMKSLLRYYTYLQGTQGNQKKVFTTACSKLLQPGLALRRTLVVNHVDEINDIIQCVDDIIHTIFNRDHLPEFLSAVTAQSDVSQRHKRTAVSYTRVLFETLEQLAMTERSDVVSGLPVIYGSFLEQNSKEQKLQKNVEFKFFCKILPLLNINESLSIQRGDVAMETEEDGVPSSVLRSISTSFLLNLQQPPTPGCLEEDGASLIVLSCLSQCLELLNDYNIYQEAEDLASGGEQYLLLKELTAFVMKQVKTHNVFECLSAILKLNHKLVEPWLPVVWLIILTGDIELSKKTEQLCRDCVLTYSKLRQLPTLIQHMFEALNLLNECLPNIPHNILTTPSLTVVVEEVIGHQLSVLPPGQSLEILEFINKYIVELAKYSSDESPPKYLAVSVFERAADLTRVVLSHIAPTTWTGRGKEKALLVLKNFSQDICHSLLNKTATSGYDDAFVSSSLLMVVVCCELMSRIHTECPQLCLQLDWPVKLVWLESSRLPVPEQWTTLEDSKQLGERGVYLLKQLAVFHLKFVHDCQVNPSNLLEFILQRNTPLYSNAVWSGQVLDINHETIRAAEWNLVLFELSSFYQHCTTEQLTSVTEGVVSSLVESDGVRVCRGDGVTVCDVMDQFLASEGLMEMRELQELLVIKCISISMSVLRKTLPKPLKKALKLCVKGADEDTLITALNAVLRDSIDKNCHVLPDHLQTARLLPVFKVLRGVALGSLTTDLQMRSLVAIIVCHVTSVHALLDSDNLKEESFQSVEQLNYLLAWVILSLTDSEASSKLTASKKKKKKKKKAAQRENERWLLPLLDLLLHWLYTAMTSLTAVVNRETARDVEVSNLVAMEILVGAWMKLGGYSQEFSTLVGGNLTSEDVLTSPVAEQCLYIITNVTCKAYRLTTTKPIKSELCSSLDYILEMVLRAMELKTERRIEHTIVCSSHPVLVSTLATLMHCRGGEWSDPIRLVKMVSSLYDNDNSQMISLIGKDHHLHYQMLCGMVDLLTLSAALRPLESHDSEEETTKEETDDDVTVSCDLSILSSWQQLHQVLCSFFEHLNNVPEALRILGCSSTTSDATFLTSSSQAEGINETLAIKFSEGLSLLLSASSKEDIETIFDQLLHMEMNSVPSACVFCYCWHRVLGCKFSQEKRMVLRRHLYKVLFGCQSIACQHSSNLLAVSAAVHLSASLLSIPSQIGLDSGSVLSSLQFFAFLSSTQQTSPLIPVLIEVMAELMLALLRQHSHVVKSSPAPVITAANKLLEAAMKQTLSDNYDNNMQYLVHCANQLTRIMDTLSRQKEFTKFAVYTIYKFIKTSQEQPVHTEVKLALLPGVFSLLKLCSQKDLAFIKASMSSEERDSLQTLIEEHHKYYKFGGRV